MAVSEIDIANLALAKLGAEQLTSLSEDNDRATLFNRLYENLRDAALEAHPWQFALKRTGPLVESFPSPAWGFNKAYALPADLLKVERTDDDTLTWDVEEGRLLSDRTSVRILYIFRVLDTTKFSPTYVEALSELIASEMAMGVTGKADLKQLHFNLYLQKVKEAKARDSQIGTPPEFFPNDFEIFRFS